MLLEPGITDATRVLLLVMVEFMREDLTVSVPRKDLARWLNRSERRIQERVKNAHDAGLLDTVVRGQKGVTAVYGALFPKPFSRTLSSTLNDTGNPPPETPFSRTYGGPTSSKRTAERSPRGGDPDERRSDEEADEKSATDDREAS